MADGILPFSEIILIPLPVLADDSRYVDGNGDSWVIKPKTLLPPRAPQRPADSDTAAATLALPPRVPP